MKKLIEQYNDKLASVYDTATKGEFQWIAPDKLIKNIKPYTRKGVEVLDIGVGTGQTASAFIKIGASVTGIDISQKMLDVAGSKFQFKQLIKYDIEKGLNNLKLQTKFDIVIAVGVFEFINDLEKLLAEIKKLLKKDGIIAFTYEYFEKDNTHGIKKTSALGEEVGPTIPKLLRFKVYRRTTMEINSILRNVKLNTLHRESFTGYLKSTLKIPVPYEIVVVKNAH